MKHVMLDLETLGTVPGCVVLSIGAVYFDEHGLGEDDAKSQALHAIQLFKLHPTLVMA